MVYDHVFCSFSASVGLLVLWKCFLSELGIGWCGYSAYSDVERRLGIQGVMLSF